MANTHEPSGRHCPRCLSDGLTNQCHHCGYSVLGPSIEETYIPYHQASNSWVNLNRTHTGFELEGSHCYIDQEKIRAEQDLQFKLHLLQTIAQDYRITSQELSSWLKERERIYWAPKPVPYSERDCWEENRLP